MCVCVYIYICIYDRSTYAYIRIHICAYTGDEGKGPTNNACNSIQVYSIPFTLYTLYMRMYTHGIYAHIHMCAYTALLAPLCNSKPLYSIPFTLYILCLGPQPQTPNPAEGRPLAGIEVYTFYSIYSYHSISRGIEYAHTHTEKV